MSQAVPVESVLQSQRDLQGRIARSYENLKKLGVANYTSGIVEARLQSLEQNWKKFEAQHDSLQRHFLEKFSSSSYATEDVFGVTEEAYLFNKGQILDVLANMKTTSPSTSLETKVHDGRSASSLPRIQLPQFSGKYSDWVSFRDIFSSLIRRDSSLTNVEKLHYLKTCVKGEAEELLKNINVTCENFTLAWTLLSNRYENKRLIIRTHLQTLTSLPSLTKESSDGLKRVLHVLYSAVGGLENIGRPIGSTTDLLVHLVVDRLDPKTKRDWEDSLSNSDEPPDYDALKIFLENRLRTLESLYPSDRAAQVIVHPPRQTSHAKAHVAEKQKNPKARCPLCSRDHFILFCEEYKKMQPSSRKDAISRFDLCINCLGRHSMVECKSTRTCLKCSLRHHTTIHDAVSSSMPDGDERGKSALTSQEDNHSNTVLLATALVKVKDRAGGHHSVRALIDPGSEISLASEGLMQRLRLPRRTASVPILGIGASPSGTSRGRAHVELQSRIDPAATLNVEVLILPRLTAYGVNCRHDARSWPHLQGLSLADPHFNQRMPVDLLLGADVYPVILEDGVRKGERHMPIAQRTSLGWVISGGFSSGDVPNAVSSLQCSVDEQLHELVQRFWTQEELPTATQAWSPEDRKCEDHFVQTHFRLQDGRYVVRLPVKDDVPRLDDTRRIARRLLLATERRLSKDAHLASQYKQFMLEYLQLDHMAAVHDSVEPRACYLPHHGVLRATSQPSKLRVVFNGSQRVSTGESLNDFLLTGPKLLPDLSDIVLRWRRHQFVFATDITKMYRQIRVHSADRRFQRILWRDGPSEPIRDFELKTVTYGLACAPFLAIRTLRQLADDESTHFPMAAPLLREDVYVDDILSGASSLEEALEVQRQLAHLCRAGGFPLSKWVANDERLLAHLPKEDTAADMGKSWDEGFAHSTLGLRWHPKDDCFSFSCVADLPPSPLTKRIVLSSIARTFDPLGWLAPSLIHAKVFFQSLWLQRLGWDTPLHARDESAWRHYAEGIPQLERIRVPRFVGLCDSRAELHGFSDASERAYAAVLYLRCVSSTGKVSVALLTAKTRVAPIKQMSLPRLELSAAVLLVRLAAHVRTTLGQPGLPVHLWTDSMVTLGWIGAHPSKWKTFVANRVAEIQVLLPAASWHHVSSKDNPADCASRGVLPQELGAHPLWWRGPSWLASASSGWDTTSPSHPSTCLPELRRTVHVAQATSVTAWDLEGRFSSLDRLLRVTAWCRRWANRVLSRVSSSLHRQETSGQPFITTSELEAARVFWIRHLQSVHFAEEVNDLGRQKDIPSRSSLVRLAPVLDDKGLLRVGGRLKHSQLSFDEKHPIILPRKSHFTRLLIEGAHHRTLHGGTQQTLGLLRRQYWIVQGRAAVKSCIRQCITCTRWRAGTPQPIMGDLPADRLRPSRPFTTTGLDYAGPLQLRTSKGRGQKSYKGYIAIFVCFSTRAVHIELVSDYTTDAFLAAFRRFTSRRGLCRTLHSDCGTNFKGADAQLRKMFQASSPAFQAIHHQLQGQGTEWKFIPPAAPHFGGLWEAAVKSVKFHLRRVVGDATLTFEEMYTLLTQIEACLNSRPLQALTDDPSDVTPLTPGHFLIGSDLLTVPEPALDDICPGRLSRWQLVQQMRDSFWRRWSEEYLHTLQARGKWWRKKANIRIGDLCVIKNELYPPSRWPLARVTKLHPGADGQTRVVTVRTQHTELKRPVVKIVILPGCDENSEN